MKKPKNTPIVQPMIDELHKPKEGAPTPPQKAPTPAESDQDPGAGFNPDHTIPQV